MSKYDINKHVVNKLKTQKPPPNMTVQWTVSYLYSQLGSFSISICLCGGYRIHWYGSNDKYNTECMKTEYKESQVFTPGYTSEVKHELLDKVYKYFDETIPGKLLAKEGYSPAPKAKLKESFDSEEFEFITAKEYLNNVFKEEPYKAKTTNEFLDASSPIKFATIPNLPDNWVNKKPILNVLAKNEDGNIIDWKDWYWDNAKTLLSVQGEYDKFFYRPCSAHEGEIKYSSTNSGSIICTANKSFKAPKGINKESLIRAYWGVWRVFHHSSALELKYPNVFIWPNIPYVPKKGKEGQEITDTEFKAICSLYGHCFCVLCKKTCRLCNEPIKRDSLRRHLENRIGQESRLAFKRGPHISKWGNHFTLDPTTACADYYLLEVLANIEHYPAAKRLMKHLDSYAAAEFYKYLGCICFGEARYIVSNSINSIHETYDGAERSLINLPLTTIPVVNYILSQSSYGTSDHSTIDVGSRQKYWSFWSKLTNNIHKTYVIKSLRDLFEAPVWNGGGIGGPLWAFIADTAYRYATGFFDDHIFVDRVWTLKHNGAIMFDKGYSYHNGHLEKVLDGHGQDDYTTLLKYCSEPVRKLWHYWYDYHKLIDLGRSAEWLGREIYADLDDLERWENIPLELYIEFNKAALFSRRSGWTQIKENLDRKLGKLFRTYGYKLPTPHQLNDLVSYVNAWVEDYTFRRSRKNKEKVQRLMNVLKDYPAVVHRLKAVDNIEALILNQAKEKIDNEIKRRQTAVLQKLKEERSA